jgi:regulator of cell morphogenesis and NO signaling
MVQTEQQTSTMREMIAHIVSTHHTYLKRELPVLTLRFQEVIAAHGKQDFALLIPMEGVFAGLREEMEAHMYKEEFILFPLIERYERAAATGQPLPMAQFGSIANPIRMMEHEHAGANSALARMRQMTGGYQLPPHACDAYRALFGGLVAMEADLGVHIHLENDILFPRVLRLEAEGR